MTGPQQIVDHWPAIQAAFASEGIAIQLTQGLALLPKLTVALSGSAPTDGDAIDLNAATLVDSPDIRSWPMTAKIQHISFDGSTTRVTFTKQDGPDRWPDVTPPGWSGPLQYTLWLFRRIAGVWVGAAFVQFWHGRDGSGSPSDPDVPSVYHHHWYYAPRWAPLFGSGPILPGEVIGFLVSSGNARDGVGPFGPAERSNVVTFAATDSGTFDF